MDKYENQHYKYFYKNNDYFNVTNLKLNKINIHLKNLNENNSDEICTGEFSDEQKYNILHARFIISLIGVFLCFSSVILYLFICVRKICNKNHHIKKKSIICEKLETLDNDMRIKILNQDKCLNNQNDENQNAFNRQFEETIIKKISILEIGNNNNNQNPTDELDTFNNQNDSKSFDLFEENNKNKNNFTLLNKYEENNSKITTEFTGKQTITVGYSKISTQEEILNLKNLSNLRLSEPENKNKINNIFQKINSEKFENYHTNSNPNLENNQINVNYENTNENLLDEEGNFNKRNIDHSHSYNILYTQKISEISQSSAKGYLSNPEIRKNHSDSYQYNKNEDDLRDSNMTLSTQKRGILEKKNSFDDIFSEEESVNSLAKKGLGRISKPKEVKMGMMNQILFMLIFCNLGVLSSSLFILDINLVKDGETICYIQGFFMNYFDLASICWSTVISSIMRKTTTIRINPGEEKKKIICYFLYCFLFPAILSIGYTKIF